MESRSSPWRNRWQGESAPAALDPKTHAIYLATAKLDFSPVTKTRRRPRIVPGTFVLLKLE